MGAFGGRRAIMEHLAPLGPVYQAGTLSGNPIAMAAGVAVIEKLSRPNTYELLEARGKRLAEGLKAAADAAGIPAFGTQVGSMTCLYFTEGPVKDWDSASKADTDFYARYFRAMLDRGFWLAPSQFEACFASLATTEADIDAFVAAAGEVLSELA